MYSRASNSQVPLSGEIWSRCFFFFNFLFFGHLGAELPLSIDPFNLVDRVLMNT